MDKVLLGMGIQAACVAALIAVGVIEATARQQAVAAVVFLVFALLYKQGGPTSFGADAAKMPAGDGQERAAIAEARFVNRWVGRPLKQWLFKKRYVKARAQLSLLVASDAEDGAPEMEDILFILVKNVYGWHVHEDYTHLFDAMDSNRVEVCGSAKGLWITEQVKCIRCGRVWQAVHPFAKELICPGCVV